MARTKSEGTRINMLFSDEVYQYIQTMAKVRGQTLTQFVNDVFTRSMQQNAELYEKAKMFQDTFK